MKTAGGRTLRTVYSVKRGARGRWVVVVGKGTAGGLTLYQALPKHINAT